MSDNEPASYLSCIFFNCKGILLTEVIRMARKSKKLKIGDKAPGFQLEDAATEKRVSLDEYLGRPLMIIFFRGTW